MYFFLFYLFLTLLALHIAAKHNHPLKHDLIPFIDVLASNTSLTEIDLSGHQIGNTGVIALAKSLQLNATLTKLFWDENETGLIGFFISFFQFLISFRFKNIRYALKINKTLRHMPLPVADISVLLRDLKDQEEQKKLQLTMQKIERSILNNQMNKNV